MNEIEKNLYLALVAYRRAQRKMLDQYAESSQEKCNQLWRDLHACEAAADVAIDAADRFYGGQAVCDVMPVVDAAMGRLFGDAA